MKIGGLHFSRGRAFDWTAEIHGGTCSITITSPDKRSKTTEISWIGGVGDDEQEGDAKALRVALEKMVEGLFAPIEVEATEQPKQEENPP